MTPIGKVLSWLVITCLFAVQAVAQTSFVKINKDDWTEISTPGPTAFITNSSVGEVRYVEATVKPDASITTGHLLHPNDQMTYSVVPGNKIFARTIQGFGSIAVSPGSTFSTGGGGESTVRITGPLTSFGEMSIAQPTPITQITANYGLLDKAQSFLVLGGTTRAENSLFVASSGTDPNGLAALLTRRQVAYRAGQGLLARFTALFDPCVANSAQEAGLIINTDRLGFGCENETFGIIYQHDGESEIQELTVTTPAAGAESATITVNGTGFTVPLTAGTVQHNAFEISESLNAQVPDYSFTSNNDQVVGRSLLATPGTTFAFSSATAAAAWVEVQNGAVPISDFVAQTNWNVDTRINTDPTINLDSQKGNVYQVQMQYLGFGGIGFFVEDQKSAQLILVHRIQFANTSITTSVGNPTFRVGWLAANSGNTTNIEVKGGSASGFVEGLAIVTEASRAAKNTAFSVPVAPTAPINIISIRNRIVFGTRRNRAETFGLSLTAATDSNKAAVIDVLIGATITGDLDFQYIDKGNSTTEIATDGGSVSGGRLVASFVIPPAGGEPFNLEQLASLILPGETMTISGQITAGAAASITVTVVFREDL